jgi:hypothetical protein
MHPIHYTVVPVTYISPTAFEVDCEVKSPVSPPGMEDRDSLDSRVMKYPETTAGASPMEGPG